MKNLIKISLITSILLVNSYALTNEEQDTKILQNESNIQVNTDSIEEDVKPRLDNVEKFSSDNRVFIGQNTLRIGDTDRKVDTNIANTNKNTSDINALKDAQGQEVLYDSYSDVDEFGNNITIEEYENTNELINTVNGYKTVIKDEHGGIISEEYSGGLESNIQDNTDSITEINNEITENMGEPIVTHNADGEMIYTFNKNEDTIYGTLHGEETEVVNTVTGETKLTQTKKGLVQLSQENITKDNAQDTQISNLQSSKADKSEVVAVNNKVDSNTQRLDDKDIKDSQQDSQISNINTVNVSQQLQIDDNISNINVEKSRNDNQDIQISNLTSSKADKSEVVAVNNKVDSNTQRLDDKDIKDSQQDSQISNINTVNVSQQLQIDDNISNINVEKSRNDNQDIQISNLTSSKADKSEVVAVNNKVDSNIQRLDDKDIKDSQQDTQINSNTNRITVVEHNVSTLISNSNSQVNSRLDNQDRKISALEKELSRTDKRENKKIASGMATNLNFDFTNGNRSFAMNHSNFNGENALGVGFAYRKNGTTISISLGTDFENVGVKTQATFSF